MNYGQIGYSASVSLRFSSEFQGKCVLENAGQQVSLHKTKK
jgi:hypothetical protein